MFSLGNSDWCGMVVSLWGVRCGASVSSGW
jgi:hypothetical protein